MVRRKLMSGSAVIRNMIKSAATRQPVASQPSNNAAALAAMAAPPTPEQSHANLQYINERINNVFNVILAEINHKNSHPSLTPSHHHSNVIYKDPYNFKDRILQDLVANHDETENYNIHELIEDEFQLEISDQDFQRFKSVTDIAKFVNERLELRRSMFPYDNGHSNSNLTY